MRNKIAWNKIIILHDFERSFVDRMQRTINSIQSKKTDTVLLTLKGTVDMFACNCWPNPILACYSLSDSHGCGL